MDLDGWSLIWFVVPGIIVPAALLVLAFRSPSWKQMTRWATQAQVTITTENEDMIRRRLARARRYRSLVSFPFWWVLAVPVITGPLPEWANDVIWIPLTGYVLGSILAAVSNTEKTGGLRVADLSPRLPSSYVPRRERLAPWLVLGVTAAALVSIKAFPPRFPQSLRTQIPLFVTAVVVAVLAEVALRMVAARPQVTDSPTRRLADNAAVHRRHRSRGLFDHALALHAQLGDLCAAGLGTSCVDRCSLDAARDGHDLRGVLGHRHTATMGPGPATIAASRTGVWPGSGCGVGQRMIITVDPAAEAAPFAQVRSQLLEAIATGALTSGTRLPTIRQLAGDLGLANNTVARASGATRRRRARAARSARHVRTRQGDRRGARRPQPTPGRAGTQLHRRRPGHRGAQR